MVLLLKKPFEGNNKNMSEYKSTCKIRKLWMRWRAAAGKRPSYKLLQIMWTIWLFLNQLHRHVEPKSLLEYFRTRQTHNSPLIQILPRLKEGQRFLHCWYQPIIIPKNRSTKGKINIKSISVFKMSTTEALTRWTWKIPSKVSTRGTSRLPKRRLLLTIGSRKKKGNHLYSSVDRGRPRTGCQTLTRTK